MGSRWERAVIGDPTFIESADVFDSSIVTDQWEWARYDKTHYEYLISMHTVVASRMLRKTVHCRM